MKKVFKYQIRPDSVRDGVHEMPVSVPAGAKFLCVQVQDGVVCVWAEVEPLRPTVTVRLLSVGTGFGTVPDGATYLGTVQEGPYVWHVYVPLHS